MTGADSEPVAHCDGHQYENVTSYDLSKSFHRFGFQTKLESFMDWFEDADEVFANEESGHRHFIVNGIEVKCNVQQLSKRYRNIYWEVSVDGD